MRPGFAWLGHKRCGIKFRPKIPGVETQVTSAGHVYAISGYAGNDCYEDVLDSLKYRHILPLGALFPGVRGVGRW